MNLTTKVHSQKIFKYSIALLIVGICTLVCLPFRDKIAANNLTMIYIIGVVIAAARFGIGPSILSSILSVVCFNFFFTKPYYSFEFYDSEYYFTFAVMLITSLIVGSLTARLSKLVEISKKEEIETHALYDFAKGLNEAKNQTDLIDFALSYLSAFFKSDFTFISNDNANKKAPKASYIPLIDNGKAIAKLQVIPKISNRKFTKNEELLQQAFASLFATSLNRNQAKDEAAIHKIEIENERLRNALLSSLSHDLRTPLTVMNGTLSNLLKHRKLLPREGVNDLTSLWQQLNRLQKFVSNLLKMASISSGNLKLNKEAYTIQEIIGAAIIRIEPYKENRQILNKISGQIPMIYVDGALIEQVLLNLLDNSIFHTEANGILNIELSTIKSMVKVCIKDDGKGIEQGMESDIFNRFQTGRDNYELNKGGTGLGLAICKAIIEAHGGKISASNNLAPQKGANFEFTLPALVEENA